MSGGSLNYACDRLDYLAEDLRNSREEVKLTNKQELMRLRLAEFTEQLAAVYKEIEWSDSGDTTSDAWVTPTNEFMTRFKILIDDLGESLPDLLSQPNFGDRDPLVKWPNLEGRIREIVIEELDKQKESEKDDEREQKAPCDSCGRFYPESTFTYNMSTGKRSCPICMTSYKKHLWRH